MVEALDYYGSDRARFDLQNKESSIKLASSDMSRNASMNDPSYPLVEYVRDNRHTVNPSVLMKGKSHTSTKFGITNQVVRDL
jgi:hypothetical protein